MAEYIDKQAFLDHMMRTGRYFDVKFDIENFPIANVAPVVHGHWIWKRRFRGEVKTYEGENEFGTKYQITVDERRYINEPYCSVCGKLSMADVLNGCPNCCAVMDGVDEYV